jgi:hypothetical protein
MVIAAIKQWTDETVYIVNRGTEAVDLADGWSLEDRKGNKLIFAQFLAGECLLPIDGVLRVHSGPICTGRKGEHTPCNEPVIDWCWTGQKIWDQDEDEAWLRRSEATVYHYSYPLKDWD